MGLEAGGWRDERIWKDWMGGNGWMDGGRGWMTSFWRKRKKLTGVFLWQTNGLHQNCQGQECVLSHLPRKLQTWRLTLFAHAAASKDAKAKSAKKAALQGAHGHSSRKTRTSVSFHRPKTLKLAREPKYPRKSIPHAPRMDQFRTIVSWVSNYLLHG